MTLVCVTALAALVAISGAAARPMHGTHPLLLVSSQLGMCMWALHDPAIIRRNFGDTHVYERGSQPDHVVAHRMRRVSHPVAQSSVQWSGSPRHAVTWQRQTLHASCSSGSLQTAAPPNRASCRPANSFTPTLHIPQLQPCLQAGFMSATVLAVSQEQCCACAQLRNGFCTAAAADAAPAGTLPALAGTCSRRCCIAAGGS
jgi:hypothetical protein